MWYSPRKNETYSSHWEIRTKNSNIIFPLQILPEHLDFVKIYPLVYEAPVVEDHQIAAPAEVINVDGQWVQQWTVRDRTPEEIPAPEPEPENPPVDPDPEPPVQSGN